MKHKYVLIVLDGRNQIGYKWNPIGIFDSQEELEDILTKATNNKLHKEIIGKNSIRYKYKQTEWSFYKIEINPTKIRMANYGLGSIEYLTTK